METWSFADAATGLFTGLKTYGAKPKAAQGVLAIPGRFDRLSQRVDITAQPPPPIVNDMGIDVSPPWYPPVIDYQPPAPAADQWQTWAWDAGTKRWVSTPTLAAHKRAARQRMAEAWNAARQAGVTLGTKTAPTDPDSWTRYLAIKAMAGDAGWIDVPIPLTDGTFELLTTANANSLWAALKTMERDLLNRLRDRIDAIAAASTQAEVEAVAW